MGLGGFATFEIAEEELEQGEHPKAWPLSGFVSDKGPDCCCLRNFLVYYLRLCIDWWFDPNHGAHHSCQHALSRAGVRVHSWLMIVAHNLGQGEWRDGSRREQVHQSVQDTVASSGGPMGDVVFRHLLPFLRASLTETSSVATTTTDEELYDTLRTTNCWHQSETRLMVLPRVDCMRQEFFGFCIISKHKHSKNRRTTGAPSGTVPPFTEIALVNRSANLILLLSHVFDSWKES